MPTTLNLHPHPSHPCPTLASLCVHLGPTTPQGLALRYQLHDPAKQLCCPPAAEPARTDLLWQHTCCELFIGQPGQSAYREFNFSPSGQWAVYDFSAYRQAAQAPAVGDAPRITTQRAGEDWLIDVLLPRPLWPTGAPWQLSLTAVIEHLNGQRSYWALHHAAAQPDFHQAASLIHPYTPDT